MRPKGIILEQINKLPTGSVHQTQNLTIATRVFIELVVDIRDILKERLISLDNTLLKWLIPK